MKKLPLLGKSPPRTTTELAARPVGAGSKPEFPTRAQYAAGLAGGASLLVAGLAGAAPPAPAPQAPPAQMASTAESGTINGAALSATRPRFRVWREGGGIGPSEDMWNPSEVQAFVNWTLAREGSFAIQVGYRLDVDGTPIVLDGFDPARNVGYIYTDQLNPPMPDASRSKLDAWIKANKLAVLFLDVKRAPDPATLQGKVIKFVAAAAKAPPMSAPLPIAAPPPPPAAKKKK